MADEIFQNVVSFPVFELNHYGPTIWPHRSGSTLIQIMITIVIFAAVSTIVITGKTYKGNIYSCFNQNVKQGMSIQEYISIFHVFVSIPFYNMMASSNFPCFWPFVRGIHRSPVNSPHSGQWRRALMFSLICDWINGWVNNREAGDLRRHRTHYDVIVIPSLPPWCLTGRWKSEYLKYMVDSKVKAPQQNTLLFHLSNLGE